LYFVVRDSLKCILDYPCFSVIRALRFPTSTPDNRQWPTLYMEQHSVTLQTAR